MSWAPQRSAVIGAGEDYHEKEVGRLRTIFRSCRALTDGGYTPWGTLKGTELAFYGEGEPCDGTDVVVIRYRQIPKVLDSLTTALAWCT